MSSSGRFGEKEEVQHGLAQMMTVYLNKFAIPPKQLYSLCSSRTFFPENQAEFRCNTKQKKVSYIYIVTWSSIKLILWSL